MKVEYGYDLYNEEFSRMEGTRITEEKYIKAENTKDFKLIREWKTEYKDRTLYGKQYNLDNGYTLFIWKEVIK